MKLKVDYDLLEKDAESSTCYHCGEPVLSKHWQQDNHLFCCNGCLSVYSLLSNSNLCDFYLFDEQNHQNNKANTFTRFDCLNDASFLDQIITYRDEKITKVTFDIPSIHCSSCIWLLEHFNKLNSAVVESIVHFKQKKLYITFLHAQTDLHEIANKLALIGYPPYFSLQQTDSSSTPKSKGKRKSWYQIGLAGFVFANIMMLSFPEYLANSSNDISPIMLRAFQYISLFLSLPLLLYSAQPFFTSALAAIKTKQLNIDAPIALAILVTFARSVYEITTHTGSGYLDSMSGIVFFMLIGRAFQDKTIEFMEFNHNYKSYFPVSVLLMSESGTEKPIQVNELKKGHLFRIHTGELVPADSVLLSPSAQLDYSFVTGESKPVDVKIGDLIYAGAKVVSGSIALEVIKPVIQSRLIALWTNHNPTKISRFQPLINRINTFFTPSVLLIALVSGIWWLNTSMALSLNAFTAVLIVVCPCILLLASTFANAATMAILGKNKFYLQNASVIESMANVNSIVFDKTGTLTEQTIDQINYHGQPLSKEEKIGTRFLAAQSAHPLSMAIKHHFETNVLVNSFNRFKNVEGMGIEAEIEGRFYQLGSATFVGLTNEVKVKSMVVYLKIDEVIKGRFEFEKPFRQGVSQTFAELIGDGFSLAVLSGDHSSEKSLIQNQVACDIPFYFHQSPVEKKQKIEEIQNSGKLCAMIGDGLNDAGALQSAEVGIAIADDTNRFTPASNVIMQGSQFNLLPKVFKLCKSTQRIIVIAFALSLLYNFTSLWFAVQGLMKPVIAAIIMPATSITMIVLTTLSVRFRAYQLGLK